MSKKVITGIVQSSKKAVTKNGQPYQVVTILDKQSSYQISIWGAQPKDTPYGRVLTLSTQEDNGFLSCILSDITVKPASSEITKELSLLLPKPPTKEQWQALSTAISTIISNYPDFCFQKVYPLSQSPDLFSTKSPELITGSKAEDYQKLSEIYLQAASRLYLPYSQGLGAVSNHHNFPGGLLQHTSELLSFFLHIYPSFPFQVNPFIVAMSCLFHDFGKLNCYTQDFQYTEEISLLDHPFISSEAVGKFLASRSIHPRLIKFIQSAVLSHHGRKEWGAPILPANPESFLVAKLDEISGHGQMYDKPSGTRALDTTIQRF